MATQQYEYVVSTGVIVPDTSTTKDEVTAEYVAAFGSDLVISDDTPQGVLIVSDTTARNVAIRNIAATANQINPNEAGGIYLDALMALTGSVRQGNTYSYTTATLAGQPGTVIPAETSTARTSNGDVFALLNPVTLDTNGQATGTFQAVLPGPVPAQIGTLTIIVSGVLGWETVTNTTDAILGTALASDEATRLFRRDTLALQGMALPEAITSALYATPGVKSLSFRENVTSAVLVIDGVSMKPHSMFACVDGGSDSDVATVLLNKKSGGCDYTNSAGIPVTVNLVDEWSGQTYPVSFSRPNLINVGVQVTISVDKSFTGDPTQTVKEEVVNYANGEIDGEDGLKVGVPVSAFEIAGAINLVTPGIFVRSVGTKYVGSPDAYSCNLLAIAIYEKAVIVEDNVVVVIV